MSDSGFKVFKFPGVCRDSYLQAVNHESTFSSHNKFKTKEECINVIKQVVSDQLKAIEFLEDGTCRHISSDVAYGEDFHKKHKNASCFIVKEKGIHR